jgi:twinkle protein
MSPGKEKDAPASTPSKTQAATKYQAHARGQVNGVSDPRRVKQLLREHVAELAPFLFPNGHREGNHWRVGSIEGEPGKSFDICIAGAKAGLWGDFAGQEKHSRSLLDLWMHARNVNFKTALRRCVLSGRLWYGEPNAARKKRIVSSGSGPSEPPPPPDCEGTLTE